MLAVVMGRSDLEQIEYVAYIAADGQVRVVTPRDIADDDVLVLLPGDLGDDIIQENPDDPERIATRKLLEYSLELREYDAPINRAAFLQATGNREVLLSRKDLICHPGLRGYIILLVNGLDGPEEMRISCEEILSDHQLFRITADDLAD